ncbi:MAG: type VI secretion protein ImpB [Bryobacteraceae bacterium]
MRPAERLETLYLDFDGFFASVMQQALPRLRGRPVGVIPFDTKVMSSTTVIACSKEAKRYGVKNVMRVRDARRLCPEIVLVPQRPDLFRRAHLTLLNEIECVIPIGAVKSIDELACSLDAAGSADPGGLAQRIKQRLRCNVGEQITCSIGFAANRLLAKIAGKVNKPDGVTIWHPDVMPAPLLDMPLSAIPGVGSRMEQRLARVRITTTAELFHTQPKQLRAIWGSVAGERLWYALHGYVIQAEPTQRSMYGHGRVLPPEWRTIEKARECSRLLLVKAARRMRRDGFYARRLLLWLNGFEDGWGGDCPLASVHDDYACLAGLELLWDRARTVLTRSFRIVSCGVALGDLTPDSARQLSLFDPDDMQRQKWERLMTTMDQLNLFHGRRVVTLGVWTPPPGGYAGGKIAYTRIPSAEDFL